MLANKLMGGSEDTLYVDNVFSTYLYTGNNSTQTINNGIDLAGKGGMVWIKHRADVSGSRLFDTNRGALNSLISSTTDAQVNTASSLTSFNSNGFSLESSVQVNNGGNIVSWTFRKAPKFFDVVTWTGNSVAGRTISHNLGVTPGFIVVKRLDTTSNWSTWHRSVSNTYMSLDTTNPTNTDNGVLWGNGSTHIPPTATEFTVSGNAQVNTNAGTYVAYLFAHDTSTDGIIQCGSFTTDASGNATVNLGLEPQYLLVKNSSSTGNWQQIDSMRGWTVDGSTALVPNLADAESSINSTWKLQSTGFSANGTTASATFIYLAIRRPNKPPTSGSQVYNAIARTGTGAAVYTTTNTFAPDLFFTKTRNNTYGSQWFDRLRGSLRLGSYGTFAEQTDSAIKFDTMNGIGLFADTSVGVNRDTDTQSDHFFRRAPGFLDEVCDTGTAAAHAISHNLTKAPELLIRKSRSAATQWEVWHSALAATEKLVLNSTDAKATDATAWNSTVPTASQFTVGTGANVNTNAATYVTYLFASLPGISKIFSYVGNGTSQNIECGFTTGARFIMIKASSTTGDWLIADTARGVVAGADPRLSLNTTAAEVTTEDWVDSYAGGFTVNQVAGSNANVNGVTYIGMAIA